MSDDSRDGFSDLCSQQIGLKQAYTPCEGLNIKLPIHWFGRDEFREFLLEGTCCSKHGRGAELRHVVDQYLMIDDHVRRKIG